MTSEPVDPDMLPQYSVCMFFPDIEEPDDSYEYVLRFVGPEEAVLKARELSKRPAAMIGLIRRIIITDAMDYCCFDWQYGKGVVFPPQPEKTK